MSLIEVVRILQLFNAKASELNEKRFADSMRAGKGSHQVTWKKDHGYTVNHDMPHIEELQAYLVTLRQFLLQRDSISFERIGAIYSDLNVSANVKDRAASIVGQVNAYLSSASHIVMDKEVVTHKHVLDVVLYGGMFHSKNPELVATGDRWSAHPALNVTLLDALLDILMDLTQLVFKMRDVNNHALAEIQTGTAWLQLSGRSFE